MCGRLRMGRKLAKSSKRLRSSTLMLAKPPPMGVVTGTFSPTRVRSMDSLSSLGMYSLYFSKASAPAAKLSHSNLTPVASSMRTVAWMTSGPMPSPGMRVTLCAINNQTLDRVIKNPSEPWVLITRFGFALRFGRVLLFLFACGFEQVLQFRHEFLHVFEVEIDGGEPYVRDLVITAQAVHDELTDFAGLALALGGLDDEGLGFIDDLLEFADGYRALLTGAHEAVENFLPVETLAASVFLYHHVRNFVDALVGGEALFALQAFAAAADGIRFLTFTRIHDFVIFKPAKGAFHALGYTQEFKMIVAGDNRSDGRGGGW